MTQDNVTTALTHARQQAAHQIAESRQRQLAAQRLEKEIRTALKTINRHYALTVPTETPRAALASLRDDFRNNPWIAGICHGGLVTTPTLAYLAMAATTPGGAGLAVLGAGVTGIFSFAVSIAAFDKDDTVKNAYKTYLSPVRLPLRYIKRALVDRNLDPRFWRPNANQLLKILDLKDNNSHLVSKYAREGITPAVADQIAATIERHINDYDRYGYFGRTRLTVGRNTLDKGAIEPMVRAVMLDPALKLANIAHQAQIEDHARVDMGGHNIKTGQYYALESAVPDETAAQQKLAQERAALDGDNVTLSAVTLFGMAAMQDAETARAAIHSWEINRHSELPGSLAALDTIMESARALRALIAEPVEKQSRLRRLFAGKKEPADVRLARISGEAMRQATNLRAQVTADIAGLEQTLNDQEKAQMVLEGHARIIAAYADAFNDASGALKKKTAVEIDGKKIVRFSADTVSQTRHALHINSVQMQQQAASFAHVRMPEQEFMMRTLPVIAARSGDILQAIEEAMRVVRLRTLSSTAAALASDSARAIREERAIAALDGLLRVWQPVVKDVKNVFALEDLTGKRLMIEDMRLDKRGQMQPARATIATIVDNGDARPRPL